MFHVPDCIEGLDLPIMRHAHAVFTELATVFSMAGCTMVMKRSFLALSSQEGKYVFRENTNGSWDILCYSTRKRCITRIYKSLCTEVGLRIDPN